MKPETASLPYHHHAAGHRFHADHVGRARAVGYLDLAAEEAAIGEKNVLRQSLADRLAAAGAGHGDGFRQSDDIAVGSEIAVRERLDGQALQRALIDRAPAQVA